VTVLRYYSRRDALRRLSAGMLLASGFWPGHALAKAGGTFRFVVINDLHYIDDDCGKWLAGVVTRIKAEKPDFCLVAGDLTEHGKREHLEGVRAVLDRLAVPYHVVIGNHDYTTHTDRTGYEQVFPNQLNYAFEHDGWQFIGLDTSEGTRYQDTRIQPATLNWVDEHLSKLSRRKPTVILTHFPLGPGVQYRPLNADELLGKFADVNVRAVFSGHFHGFTERTLNSAIFTTNRCCALKRNNHDKTTEKGFFVCEATGQHVLRSFVQVA
jgi:3',5'-cyclic AMP phosphodiesterase CpdA